MGRFNNDRDSGRRSGGRRSERPEMFDAICDECGKECKVPFRPSGDKPIYCSDCFEKMGNSSPRRDRNDSRGDSRSFRDRDTEMFSAVCDDCGKDCQVPFRPSGDKPIYCSRCFEKRGNGRDTNENDMPRTRPQKDSSQDILKKLNVLEEINNKLSKLISLLEPKKVEEKKVVAIVKPTKEKKLLLEKIEKVVKKKATKKVAK